MGEKQFKFPDVGEGITEGIVVELLVKEGDTVKKDQPVANVETDKAIVEVPSPFEGKLKKLNFKKGDTVKVGQVLLVVDVEGDDDMPEIKLSDSNELKKEEVKEVTKEPTLTPSEKPIMGSSSHHKRIKASPATRKLARDLEIDLSTVIGSGPGGRITDSDVKNANSPKAEAVKEENIDIEKIEEFEIEDVKEEIKPIVEERHVPRGVVEKLSPQIQTAPSTKVTIDGTVERVPFKGVRKTIAKRMAESKYTAPHVTHIDEADLTELWNVRKKEKKIADEKGIHLTFLPFVAKAIVAALKKYPYLNSSLDMEKNEIVLKKYYNIGIATDTEDGLMVPVIKDADKKSILQIAKDIQDLAKKARERKLSVDEMKGSTFTITNVGSVGGLISTPIINYPESSIFGFHKIIDRPVVLDGEIKIRKMVYLAVSFDHRIIDGAGVAEFLNEVIKLLEDPSRLLVDVV